MTTKVPWVVAMFALPRVAVLAEVATVVRSLILSLFVDTYGGVAYCDAWFMGGVQLEISCHIVYNFVLADVNNI